MQSRRPFIWILGVAGVVVLAAGLVLTRSHYREALPEVTPQSVSQDPPAEGSSRAVPSSSRITADTVRNAELDPAKQKKIWDLEHIVFELETFFGKPFAEALAQHDVSTLRRRFRDDFAGSVLDERTATETRHAGLSERRTLRSLSTEAGVNPNGLLEHLIDSLSAVHSIDASRMRTLHIDQPLDDSTRWNSTWLLSAVGRDASGAPVEIESLHSIEFIFSDEREIRHRPVVASWHVQEMTQRNALNFLMEEVTTSSGLAGLPLADNWKLPAPDRTQYRFQIAVDDYNRDGHTDIAIATDKGRPFLLTGGAELTFRNDAESAGIRPWRNDVANTLTFLVAWIDFDNDGYPDLLMGDRLYRNIDGKGFSDVTGTSGLRIGYEPMGCAVADYDLDGFLDLYIVYQHSQSDSGPDIDPWVGEQASGSGAPNVLWRNMGNGRFLDVTAQSGAGGGARKSFAAAWVARNDSPYPNLYVANDFGYNILLRNRGDGTFQDVTEESATGDFATSMGVASGDIDNDGHPDLYVANMYSKMGRRIIAHVQEDDYPAGVYEQILGSCAGNRLYRGAGAGQRAVEAAHASRVDEVGWAYAPAMADFDGDGLLDLYATTGFMSFSRRKPDG